MINNHIKKNDNAYNYAAGKTSKVSEIKYKEDNSCVIAFYLPQYHRIKENSEWWGEGFTEWTNVVKAKPNFENHYQPHLPKDLGFYDLSNVNVMHEQSEMAKAYGVNAFCFHYYWFSGRRILEKPIDNFLTSTIEIEYCLCWANENWTRTWDGNTKDILLEQKYLPEDPIKFIEDLKIHFSDHRYLKKNGMPVLVVYRAKAIPNPKETFEIWRAYTKSIGYPDLHIVVVDFYDIETPSEVGADALVEFPPHKFNGSDSIPTKIPKFTNENFNGGVVDYVKIVAQSINKKCPNHLLYRALIPSWDNTARRQNSPTIIINESPELFNIWLNYIRAYTRKNLNESKPLIFINAWNEWGEGCHLEPDQKWGLKYLESIKKSNYYDSNKTYEDVKQNCMLELAKTNQMTDENRTTVEAELVKLENFSQISSKIQKIAYFLRKFPLVFNVAKKIYYSLK